MNVLHENASQKIFMQNSVVDLVKRGQAAEALVDRARNLIEREDQVGSAIIQDSLAACMLHRVSSLQYEQNYTLKTMSKDHKVQMDELNAELDRELNNALSLIDSVTVSVGTATVAHSEKIDLLDKNFDQELSKIRSKCDNFVSSFEYDQMKQIEKLRKDLDIRKKAEFQSISTERDYHTNNIALSHNQSLRELQEYFDHLLANTSEQITSLEDRIKFIQDKHTSVKADTQTLQRKTESDDQPLEQAEMERLHLVQEVQKVDIGIIAHKNFKESSKELEKKLIQIKKDIKSHERIIQKLLHDQGRLADRITESSISA